MNAAGIALLVIGAVLIAAFPFLYKRYMQDWQDEADQTGDYDPHKDVHKSPNSLGEGPEA